jgi:hypothetical protein
MRSRRGLGEVITRDWGCDPAVRLKRVDKIEIVMRAEKAHKSEIVVKLKGVYYCCARQCKLEALQQSSKIGELL